MVRLALFIFIIFFSFGSFCKELANIEKKFFDFIDFNKDQKISKQEINQSIEILFLLIDKNQDGDISELEIIELKNIIDSLI